MGHFSLRIDATSAPGAFTGPDTVILKFHGIGKPHPWVPEDERVYWLEPDLFVRWIASLDSIAKEYAVTIVPTFDDGNGSDIDIAASTLARYDRLGMFFPCTARIGQKHYLDESEIRILAQMGHGIGSHGVDHVRWTTLDAEALYREAHHSKESLENILNTKVDSVAIPFGAYNRHVLRVLQCAYYKIYTSDEGIVRGCPATLNRLKIRAGDHPAVLRKAIERFRSRHFRLISNVKTIVKSLL